MVDQPPHDAYTKDFFYQKGALSIVLQGGLWDHNLINTAQYCQHWRAMLPTAQIIFSISSTDILELPEAASGLMQDLKLRHAFQDNSLLKAAANRIKRACDLVVLADGDLPLAPLKSDRKPNNGNLQIAAAKAGLALATGTYTLRVRSDVIFFDDKFLSFYLEHFRWASPKRVDEQALFQQRVMISPIWTLNPFTFERLPFHYGDLFHMGLTTDVRALWNVDPIPYRDSIFYQVHEATGYSNESERRFRARLAVEQHIHFSYINSVFPQLRLAFHNDRTSAEESLRILGDYFLVCDLRQCGFVFDKYPDAQVSRFSSLASISFEDWKTIASASAETSFAQLFSERAKEARRHSSIYARRRAVLASLIYLYRRLQGLKELISSRREAWGERRRNPFASLDEAGSSDNPDRKGREIFRTYDRAGLGRVSSSLPSGSALSSTTKKSDVE